MRALFAKSEQAEHGFVVGRLDQRDGGNLDALVGAVQALVADPETRRCRDTELREVVADIRRAGDLGLRRVRKVAACGRGERLTDWGALAELVGGPGLLHAYLRGRGLRPLLVDTDDNLAEEPGGGRAVELPCQPDVNVDGAPVRHDRISLATIDGCHRQ